MMTAQEKLELREEGMNILSLDTSTEVLSIALKTDNGYEERLIRGNFSHSEHLLSEILSLLERSSLCLKDLDLLVAAKGPGSFTGLRVGIASLKGIRAAGNARMVSVPTLDAMAYTVRGLSENPVLAVIDARKDRFYSAIYSADGNSLGGVTDSFPSAIIESLKSYDKVTLIGKDAHLFLSRIGEEEKKKFIIDASWPRNIARALMELGIRKLEKDGEDEIGSGPLYVRRSDAEEALLRKMENNNA